MIVSEQEIWYRIAATVYYTGAGAVLLGTTIRFLYRLTKRLDDDSKTLKDLQDVDVKAHLGNIYIALQTIANELNIRLNLNSPGLPLEDSWILSDSQTKRK